MEEYNKMAEENTTASRGNFYYGSSPVSSSVYGRTTTTPVPAGLSQVQISNFHLQQPNESCFEQQSDGQVPVQVQVQVHPTVKTEAGGSSSLKFQYPSIIRSLHSFQDHHLQQQQEETGGSFGEVEAIKAKIIAHPQYSNILEAYMDCQKVGAPPEVVAKLTAVRKEFEAKQRASVAVAGRDARTKDPELDQFMEAYYDMLVKYSEQLTKTLQEATDFARKVEEQLNTLSIGSLKILNPDEKCQVGVGSSEEEQDNSGGETELPEINPRAEDRELKNHLLKKYSGYLSSLKQELSKKKKKGKLPKDARQKLLSWWELHYKWPYPSESEKAGLAEATGLDQKQINNWFINQRKRHWKPSEDMQFLGMDAGGLHSQNAALYMEGHYMGTGPYRFCP